MRISTARWLARDVAAASVGLMTGGLVLAFVDRNRVPPSLTNWDFTDVFAGAQDLTIPVIAFVLASRRPRNPIGWLGLAASLALATANFATSYGLRALVAAPGSLPVGDAAMWVANSIWVIPAAAVAFVFLLFPAGRLRSRRWRPAAWFVASVFTLVLVAAMAGATRAYARPFASFASTQLPGVLRLELALVPVAMAVSVAAVAVRFVRSQGEERLQLKWFATAAAVVIVTFIPARCSSTGSTTSTS